MPERLTPLSLRCLLALDTSLGQVWYMPAAGGWLLGLHAFPDYTILPLPLAGYAGPQSGPLLYPCLSLPSPQHCFQYIWMPCFLCLGLLSVQHRLALYSCHPACTHLLFTPDLVCPLRVAGPGCMAPVGTCWVCAAQCMCSGGQGRQYPGVASQLQVLLLLVSGPCGWCLLAQRSRHGCVC
jgi:hypothetical protein